MTRALVLCALLFAACGTVTANPHDAGGTGGQLATGGAGGALAAATGGQGGHDVGAGGAAGAPSSSTGGTAWPACPYPINQANAQETVNCFDRCSTTTKDDAGLFIQDNFGQCVGTTAESIGYGATALSAGVVIYCRQNMSIVAGQVDPKETPDAAACP